MTLEPCPTSGGGVHLWLARAARFYERAGMDANQVAAKIIEGVQGCGRSVPARELNSAVSFVFKTPTEKLTSREYVAKQRGKIPRISINKQFRRQVVSNEMPLDELYYKSPIETAELCSSDYLRHLFKPNELVCIASGGPATARTRPLSDWLENLDGCDLVVPSPMVAETGTNQDGKPSTRCADNTGPRRFLVIECDHGTQDEQSAILWHMRLYSPLALVCFSGSKSLHGWLDVSDKNEELVRRIHAYAASLGADTATFTTCQLVRLPGGTRDANKHQTVHYFDPYAIRHLNVTPQWKVSQKCSPLSSKTQTDHQSSDHSHPLSQPMHSS